MGRGILTATQWQTILWLKGVATSTIYVQCYKPLYNKKSLNNKNARILTPKFALKIVHTGNLSSKLLQRQVKYFNELQKGRWAIFPYESLYESLTEKFCSCTVRVFSILEDAPPNLLVNHSLGLQVTYSPKGEWQGSCFQQFIQREQHQLKTSTMNPLYPKLYTDFYLHGLALQVVKLSLRTRLSLRERRRSESEFPILDVF